MRTQPRLPQSCTDSLSILHARINCLKNGGVVQTFATDLHAQALSALEAISCRDENLRWMTSREVRRTRLLQGLLGPLVVCVARAMLRTAARGAGCGSRL